MSMRYVFMEKYTVMAQLTACRHIHMSPIGNIHSGAQTMSVCYPSRRRLTLMMFSGVIHVLGMRDGTSSMICYADFKLLRERERERERERV
jgi:hypothetical protein